MSPSLSPVMFPELSLTSHNLSTVLRSMDDDKWDNFSRYVNIPVSQRQKIKSQYSSAKERKQAAIDYLISSHPAPSWRLVAHALYQMAKYGRQSDSSHRALDDLQQLFPTGTLHIRVCNICVGNSISQVQYAGCCRFKYYLKQLIFL